MPDSRKHRGQHPNDARLFDAKQWPKLSEAVIDLSWLFSRGYSDKATLKLVGDKYRLTERQRKAVWRCSCSDQAIERRKKQEVLVGDLVGKTICIDGYNLLINIESALSGGLIFEGKDTSYRDLASVHGTYRRVEETIPAIHLIAKSLEKLQLGKVNWYFDTPVGNSGKLKVMMYELIVQHQWNWDVELAHNPDQVLIDSGEIVVSSDSMVMDESYRWTNIGRYIVDEMVEGAQMVRLV